MNFLFRSTISHLLVLFSCMTITCVNAQKVTAPSFTMVQNGHSSAVIVTAVNAGKDELLAANELSEYVFKNYTLRVFTSVPGLPTTGPEKFHLCTGATHYGTRKVERRPRRSQ